MTTTYTLLSGQSAPGSTPGVTAVAGSPTRGQFVFSITGLATSFAQATVMASVDGVDYQPIETLNILPTGPNTLTKETRFGSPFTSFDATLDSMSYGQGVSATVQMVV